MPKSDEGYTRKAYIISLIKWGIFKEVILWNKERPETRNEKGIMNGVEGNDTK